MTDDTPDGAGRRSIPIWLRIFLALAAIGILGTVAFLALRDGNRARTAADWVPQFAEASGAVAYCANGYGSGIDNQTAWWEWTLLADRDPDVFAADLAAGLAEEGFVVASSQGSPAEYGENSSLNKLEYLESRGWATSWTRLDGSRSDGVSVIARVADGETLNNCFESDVLVPEAEPSEADVVAVVMFRDDDG